jgi:hypothetical protein
VKSKISSLLCVGFLFLAGVLSGCTGAASQEKLNIFDDESAIVQEADHYTYLNRVGTENTSERIDLQYSGFSGSDTIWTFEVEEAGQISLEFDSTVASGDFKVVLVTPEQEIEEVLVGEQAGDQTFDLTAGKTVLRLIGREASGQIVLEITQSQNVEITRID